MRKILFLCLLLLPLLGWSQQQPRWSVNIRQSYTLTFGEHWSPGTAGWWLETERRVKRLRHGKEIRAGLTLGYQDFGPEWAVSLKYRKTFDGIRVGKYGKAIPLRWFLELRSRQGSLLLQKKSLYSSAYGLQIGLSKKLGKKFQPELALCTEWCFAPSRGLYSPVRQGLYAGLELRFPFGRKTADNAYSPDF